MADSSSSEVEIDPYEEIVGLNLNYSTPMASRTSSPLPRDKNKSDMTHFNGPIVKCSESEAVSTSTGLVASVTWPDLRYPCSLAGKNSSATVAQHLDGNTLRATVRPSKDIDLVEYGLDCLKIKTLAKTVMINKYVG